MIFTSLFHHVFSSFVERSFFGFSSFCHFRLFRRHAFHPIKTTVLTHSTLSENFNSILQNIQKYHISCHVRFYFHIDFSSIFKTSSATIFALIFIENGSRTHRGRPNGPPFLVPFSRSLPHVDFCIQSGHPLAPFGLPFPLPFPPPGYLFTPPLPMASPYVPPGVSFFLH